MMIATEESGFGDIDEEDGEEESDAEGGEVEIFGEIAEESGDGGKEEGGEEERADPADLEVGIDVAAVGLSEDPGHGGVPGDIGDAPDPEAPVADAREGEAAGGGVDIGPDESAIGESDIAAEESDEVTEEGACGEVGDAVDEDESDEGGGGEEDFFDESGDGGWGGAEGMDAEEDEERERADGDGGEADGAGAFEEEEGDEEVEHVEISPMEKVPILADLGGEVEGAEHGDLAEDIFGGGDA